MADFALVAGWAGWFDVYFVYDFFNLRILADFSEFLQMKSEKFMGDFSVFIPR